MGVYRLKRGSYAQGRIGDVDNPHQFFTAKKEGNNIVESDIDLASRYPEKFEYHDGPAPQKAIGPVFAGTNAAYSVPGQEGLDPPPGPPSDADQAFAQFRNPRTVAEARQQAELLRRKAEELESSAAESERAFNEGKARDESSKPKTATNSTATKETKTTSIPSDSELHSMPKEDLKTLAELENVTVSSNANKNELIHALKAARDS